MLLWNRIRTSFDASIMSCLALVLNYPHSKLTSYCSILVMPCTRLGREKLLFFVCVKSLVWLGQESNSCSSVWEACALPIVPPHRVVRHRTICIPNGSISPLGLFKPLFMWWLLCKCVIVLVYIVTFVTIQYVFYHHKYILYISKCMHILYPRNELYQSSLVSM